MRLELQRVAAQSDSSVHLADVHDAIRSTLQTHAGEPVSLVVSAVRLMLSARLDELGAPGAEIAARHERRSRELAVFERDTVHDLQTERTTNAELITRVKLLVDLTQRCTNVWVATSKADSAAVHTEHKMMSIASPVLRDWFLSPAEMVELRTTMSGSGYLAYYEVFANTCTSAGSKRGPGAAADVDGDIVTDMRIRLNSISHGLVTISPAPVMFRTVLTSVEFLLTSITSDAALNRSDRIVYAPLGAPDAAAAAV
jgi:hypothetical protein